MASKARKQLRAKTQQKVNEANKDLSMDSLKNVLAAEISGWKDEKILNVKEGLVHAGMVGAGIGAGVLASKLNQGPSNEDLIMKFDNIEKSTIDHSISRGDEGYEY